MVFTELRSSAVSGATDRKEEEHVPHFYGRIDEKFAEWEIVRLWQVEFKEEDRDRLGPRLYRRGFAWTAEDHCVNEARHTRCVAVQWTTSSNASKTLVMKNFLRSLDKRHWMTIST